jgi:hypothetical protein
VQGGCDGSFGDVKDLADRFVVEVGVVAEEQRETLPLRQSANREDDVAVVTVGLRAPGSQLRRRDRADPDEAATPTG